MRGEEGHRRDRERRKVIDARRAELEAENVTAGPMEKATAVWNNGEVHAAAYCPMCGQPLPNQEPKP